MLHHDNACPRTAQCVEDFSASHGVEVIPHTSYYPDHASCDLFLFPMGKRDLKGRHFESPQAVLDYAEGEMSPGNTPTMPLAEIKIGLENRYHNSTYDESSSFSSFILFLSFSPFLSSTFSLSLESESVSFLVSAASFLHLAVFLNFFLF